MKILISQKAPSSSNAYIPLQEKFGVEVEFHPLFLIEPLSDKEFRAQRINLQEFTAIVFSSRHAIDAYFKLCEGLRIKVPDTMKYFCTTEMVAMYLQKHIVYRKRKIFFGDGTPTSLVSLIGSKHREEKFLITSAEGSNPGALTRLFDDKKLNYSVGSLVKPVSQDLHDLDLHSFDYMVLYNPSDVKSLYENYPDFKPEGIKFISFGKSIVKAMDEAGLETVFQGPTPEAPSAAKAIELCLSSSK